MWSTAPDSPRRRSRRRLARSVGIVLVGLIFTGGAAWSQAAKTDGGGSSQAVAAEAQATEARSPESGEPSEAPADAPVSSGGLRVFVDPETGEILAQPRPEQLRELQALERQRLASPIGAIETKPVRVFAIPGGVGADLPPSTMSSTVLRVLPDGSFETLCLDHPADAAHEHPADASERPKSADREEVR